MMTFHHIFLMIVLITINVMTFGTSDNIEASSTPSPLNNPSGINPEISNKHPSCLYMHTSTNAPDQTTIPPYFAYFIQPLSRTPEKCPEGQVKDSKGLCRQLL